MTDRLVQAVLKMFHEALRLEEQYGDAALRQALKEFMDAWMPEDTKK